jgi:hypothetical protein
MTLNDLEQYITEDGYPYKWQNKKVFNVRQSVGTKSGQ